MHCHAAWGQWASDFLHYTAALCGGRGRLNSCTAPPHTLGAMGREHLQFIAALLVGSGKYSCCNALPHYQRAVGRGTPAIHHHTAWGHYALELLQCTLKLPLGQRAVELLQ